MRPFVIIWCRRINNTYHNYDCFVANICTDTNKHRTTKPTKKSNENDFSSTKKY